MYGNIPNAKILFALKECLTKSKNFIEIKTEGLLSIIQVIKDQNYIHWKGKYYYESKGLPMGGPLSGLLAEIYIQKFEKTR